MLGFIGYYGLAAAPPITAMVVSVCSDGRSQVSSLECVSCSHWSPNILDSKGSQKDLFTFSNLKTKCIPKCPLLRCTPTQVYEDTGRWKSWVSMGKHGIQHGIIGYPTKAREEHSGKWVFTSGLSWKLWGVFLVLATGPPKFCLQPCPVKFNWTPYKAVSSHLTLWWQLLSGSWSQCSLRSIFSNPMNGFDLRKDEAEFRWAPLHHAQAFVMP